jgi:Tfp pilus assembly protein PilN
VQEFTLSTWGNIANIIGAGSIVTGLIVGWIQIRHLRRQQRDAVAINLAQTFYSHDLAHAIALLQPLPDGISLTQLRAMGERYEIAALTVCTSFETMGLLAFKRIAPIDLVLDLAGGIVSVMARKLHQWNEDLRAEQQQPSWGEWFEWLGDQAQQRKSQSVPAHIKHQNWKP